MEVGWLKDRVAFDEPTGVITPTGGQVTTWTQRIASVWADIRYLRGGDAVIAARLAGKQPAVVKVWASPAAREITPDWRLRDLRGGQTYAIRAIVETSDRAFLEITCEATK